MNKRGQVVGTSMKLAEQLQELPDSALLLVKGIVDEEVKWRRLGVQG